MMILRHDGKVLASVPCRLGRSEALWVDPRSTIYGHGGFSGSRRLHVCENKPRSRTLPRAFILEKLATAEVFAVPAFCHPHMF